ncbi:Sir2 family NAD-dependent protein deacetylase [Shigella flexneri]
MGLVPFAADGLWEEHRVEDVATRKVSIAILNWCKSFITPVVDSYSGQKLSLTPRILRWLNCKRLGNGFLLVTQNIDNLHERAGNTNVIHLHGELLKVHCSQSGQVIDWTGDVTPKINAIVASFRHP